MSDSFVDPLFTGRMTASVCGLKKGQWVSALCVQGGSILAQPNGLKNRYIAALRAVWVNERFFKRDEQPVLPLFQIK